MTPLISSVTPGPLWSVPPKQRLHDLLTLRPARTRVAPSPTGRLHLGTVRTALHNRLAAAASGGHFLLRIDDTDDARNDPAHTTQILTTLKTLGLTWDNMIQQSQRQAVYRSHAARMVACGVAVQSADGCVRLAADAIQQAPAQLFDVACGVYAISDTWLGHCRDLVLLRSDGSATYHFASVVDDVDCSINVIIRGMDHQPNAIKHVLIAQALDRSGWDMAKNWLDTVVMGHVGLIMKDGKKLSKRDSDDGVDVLHPDIPVGATLQWALGLGWGHPDPMFDRSNPLIALTDMPAIFAQGGLRSAGCDWNRPKWDNLSRKWRGRVGSHSPKSDPNGVQYPSKTSL